MNNRIISALVLAGMIASTSAFASRARNAVMGQGGAQSVSGQGSFFYDDAYNFFYNPAYVNDYKNWVIMEKGDATSSTTDRASFGFVTSMMNFNMGIFFNRAGGIANTANTKQPIDLIFGGDTGVKWGVSLQYAQNIVPNAVTAGENDKGSELNARVGISMNGLDPYISYRVIGKTQVAGVDAEKYKGYGAGLRYHFGEWTPYAAYNMNKKETATAGSEDEDKTTSFLVGVGRETKLAEGARLVYSIYYVNSTNTVKDIVAGTESEAKGNALPIELAVEADALTWLTLRGGVTHTLVGTTNKTTTARVGGTFHVGKVDLDYAFGNSAAATSIDSADIGFDSGTFHQVAMRYSW